MTAAFDPAPDADDRPAGPSRALVPYRPRPGRLARVFRWWLGLSVAVLFLGALFAGLGLHGLDLSPVHIVINGDDLNDGISVTGLDPGAQAMLGAGALTLALLLLLLIPLLLFLILGAVAIALLCAVAVPLAALALVIGVATSPAWILALVIWRVVRRHDAPPLPASARMAA